MGSFEFPVTLVVAAFIFVMDDLGYTEGFSVERGLWDEAVGEGQAEDASYACCETEKE